MASQAGSAPGAGYTGREVAFRFEEIRDLGPVPKEVPSPPKLIDQISKPKSKENDLSFLTIVEASVRIKEGNLSSLELTRAVLARIERLNPVLNSYITITSDLALKLAREADREIQNGNYRGPLHGIPISLKDLVATSGVLTTGGTGALADWVPKTDAVIWRKLREAGAVLVGKTNLHEMAAGSTNLNPFYGPARNPWDIHRITGGSSGGSGAAIAGHLCLGTIGSDTGGSIRMPASLCGTVGLKPTFGRVSTKGALYLSWTNDHLGPLTKTVEDSALMMNVIAGYDPTNPLSANVEDEDFTLSIRENIKGMRIAVPTDYFWELELRDQENGTEIRVGPDPEIVKAVHSALDVFRDLGASVIEVPLPGFKDLMRTSTIASAERGYYLEELPEERKKRFSQRYRDGNTRGLNSSSGSYLSNLHLGYQVQSILEHALEKFDAFVLPSTPIVAPPIKAALAAANRADVFALEDKTQDAPAVREIGPTSIIGRYTAPFNRSGQPALSLPCGFTSDGLPIGMMIAGKRFADASVLQLGHAYQKVTDWHNRRPQHLDGAD
jgi:aspartyl-tRNA(Asn)/glutamyl-tRNA(Gln) amidotransferase subunit A